MSYPRIAIIDSGISPDQISRTYKINVIGELLDPLDKINHGSVIFNMVKKYSEDISVRIIKITDTYELQEESLCAALELLLNDLDVDIINISMGIVVSEMREEISALCMELKKRGVIIVAAFDNDGAMSYPAALPSVIGVDISPRCKLINQYEYVDDEIINIRAFSGVLHIKVDEKILSVAGTSFACAIMTAKISDILKLGITTFDAVLNKLKEEAIYVVPKIVCTPLPQMPKVQKAIIFPFNKEMNALLANQDLLSFEIEGVFDIAQLGNVGKKISDILVGPIKKDFIVNNVFKIIWEKNFDTVILGHTREISQTLGFNFNDYFIKQCEKYKKILYSFDNIDLNEDTKNIYIPRVLECNVPQNRFGKLYQVHCPVLGVFGTSSKQGKFTLQLKLRRHFIKAKYNLVQLGTEPSSLLFGMDAVYPMGYDGIVPKNSRSSIITVNDILNRSVSGNTDIVLVGSQSNSNVYSYQNISLFPVETFDFLLGVQPDAILLCVNTFDDDEYIYRTIMVLENMIGTYVIALVISPVSHMYIDSGLSRKTNQVDTEKIEEFKKHLTETFKREVFVLDFAEDAQDIFNHCIKVLGGGE